MSQKPLSATIKTIMSRQLYLSGNEFTSVEMTSNLKNSKEATQSALREMFKQGTLSRRLQRNGLRSTAYWSRRGNHWLRMPWRIKSDSAIGIQA